MTERKIKSNKFKSAQAIKLEDAIRNAKKYINIMSKWSDKRLEKHLDLFRAQKKMAQDSNKLEAFNLLCEYEDQVILARLKKILTDI